MPGTLVDQQRDLARTRILRAAGEVLATRGLTATMDDVAEVAGVNRRTVFRHFATRDGLFAQAILAGVHRYAEHLPAAPETGDLRAWLRELLLVTHRLNADNGRVFWEIAALPTSPLLRTRRRRAGEPQGAQQLRGQGDRPPLAGQGRQRQTTEWLVDAVAVQLSGFTTQSLSGDLGRSPADVADVAARVIEAVRFALSAR